MTNKKKDDPCTFCDGLDSDNCKECRTTGLSDPRAQAEALGLVWSPLGYAKRETGFPCFRVFDLSDNGDNVAFTATGLDEKKAEDIARLFAAAPALKKVAEYMRARLERENPNDGLLHDVREALRLAGDAR